MVYLLADRSLAPCVVAHFLISALIEPGLMHAAVQDKIGIWRSREPGMERELIDPPLRSISPSDAPALATRPRE